MEVEKSGLLVDALPYIDHGYDEAGVREAVSREYIRIDIGIALLSISFPGISFG